MRIRITPVKRSNKHPQLVLVELERKLYIINKLCIVPVLLITVPILVARVRFLKYALLETWKRSNDVSFSLN